MIFPFTFNFSVPGILNPFSKVSPSLSPPVPYSSRALAGMSRAQLPKIERRPSPSPSTSASTSNTLRALPLSRKRGWEPTFGAESLQSLSPPAGRGKTDSTTSLTLLSSSGYLDTPAKYRDMAGDITMGDDAYIEGERREAEEDAPPPLKKRRGLAGSIVSTAVSAALIGTAVGLTVYRLWRDRGKEHQAQLTHPSSSSRPSTPGSDSDPQVPPPPYDPGAWKPPVQHQQQPMMAPRCPHLARRIDGSRGLLDIRVHRGSVRRAARPPRVRPEFDFGRERGVGLGIGSDAGAGSSAGQEEGGGVEDKMDWIGDKLSMLIEQGRRALQSEVVVMSEAKEDEVDDGRGGWEEDEEDNEGEGERRSLSVSRNGSTKSRSRAGMSTFPSTSSASASVSVSASAALPPPPSSPSSNLISASVGTPSRSMGREDSEVWESPELRESMERARARALARRAGVGAGGPV
ncbi:hypothetical protein CPB84DRAFT_1835857 [Gymnopilus junonius]|uniref:Uncharacterized protein n=1 Tax=Gymnopilus junonius TaxID=109634 RepID=A0A9P5NR21_GYMJU|nr:hypothetical protein CPB84DRAFT_1835857 [Gymnopilus junonius]